MRKHRPSREERRQLEKTELSRQKLQEQAFLETQRNVFARIQRGEDYWDGRTMESWDHPPTDWGPPPTSRSWQAEPDEGNDPSRSGRPHPDDDWGEYPSREELARRGDEPDYLEDDRDCSPGSQGYRDPDHPDWGYTRLNPAIVEMQWEEPEEPRKRKRRIRPLLVTLFLLLLLLAGGLVLAHQVFVYPPDVTADSQARKEGVYTFLLVGRDDGEGGGGNTDTIMVGCFDTVNGTVDVLSIFRDTLVDVPWDLKKINSVYNGQGIEGLKTQVKNLVGYAPDCYFVVEMSLVAQLVDAIGGVDYDVPYNMDYDDPVQDLHIHYTQGMQHLDGEDAVRILRWRKNNSGENLSVGDVGRVELQHTFLKSTMRQAVSMDTLRQLPRLKELMDRELVTDLRYGQMIWLAERALELQENGIRFHSLPGDYDGTMWSTTYQNYQSYVFVNGSELLDIVNQYMNPYQQDIPPESQHILNGTTVSSQMVLPERSGGGQ